MSSGLGFVHPWPNPVIAFRSSAHSLPILQSGRGLIGCNVKALKSVPNSDTVVAADASYGRKEVISVNPRLYDYLLANVREPKGYSSLAVALVLPEVRKRVSERVT